MKKLIPFLILSSLLLSSCSIIPEKEVVTKVEIFKPTIDIVDRPEQLSLTDANIVVITEKNIKEIKMHPLGDLVCLFQHSLRIVFQAHYLQLRPVQTTFL